MYGWAIVLGWAALIAIVGLVLNHLETRRKVRAITGNCTDPDIWCWHRIVKSDEQGCYKVQICHKQVKHRSDWRNNVYWEDAIYGSIEQARDSIDRHRAHLKEQRENSRANRKWADQPFEEVYP